MKEVKYEKYVERYQEIYTKLPYGILSREDHSADLSDQVRTWLMAYIDLCAEELFDRQRGKIDDVVWNDWAALIRDGLNCPRPHAVLEEHKADYKYLYGFVKTEEVPKLDGVRRQSESEMK
ncbi:MAG: hypothetical protein JRN33_04795 [Nitrososphaerota archaeon]|nr:hypothetical protein [Nitrososphaerota archaeon]